MPTRKAVQVGLDELRWLTRIEAMAWTRRKTERKFMEDFGNKVKVYRGSGGCLYDKKELDRLQLTMIEIDNTR